MARSAIARLGSWTAALGLCSVLCAVPSAGAATVAEYLAQVSANIPDDEIKEPGSQARAKAIAGLLNEDLGLTPSDLIDLRLELAEAWLDALKPDEAEKAIGDVLAGTDAASAQRERAGLTWAAAFEVRLLTAPDPALLPSPIETVAVFGDLGQRVAARVHSVQAKRLLAVKKDGKVADPDAALAHFDRALELLKDDTPEQRIPVYHLRLLAMEAVGHNAEAVQKWLHAHREDPAAAEVLDTALTSGQKLIGQAAPELKAKRLDGGDGEIDIAAFKGKPVLVDFFATWHKPCGAIAPAISAIATKYAAMGLVTVGVSLDNKETIGQLPGYIAANAITYPIVGDALGWDSELDDAWHVDSIPTLILIDANGRIAAIDLHAATAEETTRNLENALAPVVKNPDQPFIP
ncbi:MAG: TlpA family protein disulfide reductase [Planctomycetes bacterium]|nr:TlpA family protein disulfide reductase [Planctomycetota bacterium]